MSTGTTRRRAIAFAAAMSATALLAEVAKPRRIDQPRAKQPLGDVFPREFGDWQGNDTSQLFVQPRDDQGRLYGVYDQVLLRGYANSLGERVMLCVAYGNEQSSALQLHRPEVCYAGSGFTIAEIERVTLDLGRTKLAVTRLHAVKVGRSEPLTYWTVLGDTVVRDGGSFRWGQLIAGLRREVRDGMLVRVSSLNPQAEPAYLLHSRFTNELASAIRPEFRDRVFGGTQPV